MLIQDLKPNSIVQGPLFKEPVQVSVITTSNGGDLLSL
jgi:hypothetical protein